MNTARNSASARRVLAGFLALLLIAALAVVLAPAAKAESSRINRMDITCRIDESGDAVITEVIDIDAYQGTEYYQVSNVRGNQQIRDLIVSENGVTFQDVGAWDVDAAEKRGRSGIVTTDSGYELCFGIGEYGNHVFQMQYTVVNFVSRWSDSYGVNYMFFSDIPLEIESASVTLEGPDVYTDDNASIWAFGYEGSVVFEDGRVVMQTDNSHLRGMQLLMVFETGRDFVHTNDYDADRTFMDVYNEAEEGSSYEQQEERSDSGSHSGSRSGKGIWFFPVLFVGGFAALIALFATFGTKKVYEDQEGYKQAKSKSVTPYRDIPCDKDLVRFSRVLTDLRGSSEFLKTTLVSAYILKWLQKDIISVVEGPEKGVFKKTQTYKIILTESPAILDLNERHLYNMLWDAARSDHILEKNEFQRYCKRNYSDVNRWFDTVKDDGTRRLREKGLIRTETVAQKGLIRKRNTEVYTTAYNEELAHVNGFQRFLEDEDNMAEKSMIEVKLWDEYLVFATVMGIADQVYRQAKLAVPQFDEHYYGYDPYMAYLVAHDFGDAGARGVAAGASSSSGSSSFGGGGSSFSGGGGGGLR